MVSRALQAATQLEARGFQARVLNLATVKPLDAEALVRAASETRRMVTVEETVVDGGMGSAVAALLAQRCPVPMRILGVPEFAPTGSTAFLLDHFGLNAAGIEAAALELALLRRTHGQPRSSSPSTRERSSTKCLLVDERGEVVARGSAPLGEQHPQAGVGGAGRPGDRARACSEAVRACLEGGIRWTWSRWA